MTPGPSVDLGIEGITDATRIGRGGMGTVYRAKETVLDRTVAVKVLDAGTLDERESRALAGVSGHPHVAALYKWGNTNGGQPYLVLEYLPGGTLAERLEEFGPMPFEDVAEIGVKLAGGLAAVHGAGVLHGDLKPENVLVSSFDEPKLTDFGLARTRGGGSPAHAAPEVLAGRPATEASDVYSLASTLYALAAGQPPIAAPADALDQVPPDPRSQGVPAPLWEALAAALVKDPGARTSSARALGDALRAAQRVGGLAPTRMVVPDPVVIAPATTAREARSDGGRAPGARPALATALVVAIVALLAAGAVALTRVDDDDTGGNGTALPAATRTVVPSTAATAPPATPSTAAAPSTTAAPATTTSTTAPASLPTTAPAGGIPVCSPAFFRSTVVSDRPRYNNGDTVEVSARFENVSGLACSYTQTGASSQLFNPFGEPMGPIRTLVGDNVDNVAFEPGTSQTFRASWEVNTCVNPTTCYPGRYTITMNVVPFGSGQASFDVT